MTALLGLPSSDRPELIALVRRSVEAFNAMSPEERREHRAAQRKSWVVGELMLSNPEMTRAEASRLYDKTVSA